MLTEFYSMMDDSFKRARVSTCAESTHGALVTGEHLLVLRAHVLMNSFLLLMMAKTVQVRPMILKNNEFE